MIADLFSRPVAHRGLFSVAVNQTFSHKARVAAPEPCEFGPVDTELLPPQGLLGRGVENSMTAFQNAKDHGFAIECDVRLSADQVPCIFHDAELGRLTSASGLLREKNWEEICNICLLKTTDRIPRLRDLLDLASGAVPLVIELKSFDHGGWQRDLLLERAVLRELDEYSKHQQTHLKIGLKSFNPHSVEYLLSQRSQWPIGFLSCKHSADGDFGFLSSHEGLELEKLSHSAARQADFISYGIHDLTPELLQKVNKPFMTWTIRTSEQLAKAQSMGATQIFEETVASKLLLI